MNASASSVAREHVVAADPVSLQGAQPDWQICRPLTCSVLPVRMACNLHCPFCFSKSSVSTLRHDTVDWSRLHLESYYELARSRGATRLVITGGGEPLLRPDDVVQLVARGRRFFMEIACFTNGTFLTRDLAQRLADAGLSYLCYSRHHDNDSRCRDLMGNQAPTLAEFFAAARPLKVRATCVMARGWIESHVDVFRYIDRLSEFGVREFTFKHTYVAHQWSLFRQSREDLWAREHQSETDPFTDCGEVVSALPWGPQIRRIGAHQVCYYFEPNPDWELEKKLCRSWNLLSDGRVYASLEDRRSLLFQLKH